MVSSRQSRRKYAPIANIKCPPAKNRSNIIAANELSLAPIFTSKALRQTTLRLPILYIENEQLKLC